MNYGIMIETNKSIEKLVSSLKSSQTEGINEFWVSQIFGYDSLTLIGILSQHIKDVSFGTAVVPIQPKHPFALALQALTVSSSMSQKLTLGIGLSHQMVIENIYGLSFLKPAEQMQEYLQILNPVLRGEGVNFSGEHYRVSYMGKVEISTGNRPSVIVAALGTKMLEIAGKLADGTATWMTGLNTVRDHIVPNISNSAEKSGKNAPEIIVGLPICVTENIEQAKQMASNLFAIYGSLPSYRSMLDKEKASGPEDVAIIGSQQQVSETLLSLPNYGATKFIGGVFGNSKEIENTISLIAQINANKIRA